MSNPIYGQETPPRHLRDCWDPRTPGLRNDIERKIDEDELDIAKQVLRELIFSGTTRARITLTLGATMSVVCRCQVPEEVTDPGHDSRDLDNDQIWATSRRSLTAYDY